MESINPTNAQSMINDEGQHTLSTQVSCKQLHKSFGKKAALNNIDLTLNNGHVIGLVGPNGGGKSTLLQHIMGILLPTRGQVSTFGVASHELAHEQLQHIGYVHQNAELPDWMTGKQLIEYVASHYEYWNEQLEHALIDQFAIDTSQHVSKMSPGNKQKLSIILAVCYEPKLLILDEPASALDPQARQTFLSLLMELIQDQSRTIIISSHLLSDIEKVIDHVLVLDKGQLLKDCAYDELLEDFVSIQINARDNAVPERLPLNNVFEWQHTPQMAHAVLYKPSMSIADLAQQIGCEITPSALSLEEIYPLVLKHLNTGK